jgi:hypothetical protein
LGGLNVYAYLGNHPLLGTDLTGLCNLGLVETGVEDEVAGFAGLVGISVGEWASAGLISGLGASVAFTYSVNNIATGAEDISAGVSSDSGQAAPTTNETIANAASQNYGSSDFGVGKNNGFSKGQG